MSWFKKKKNAETDEDIIMRIIRWNALNNIVFEEQRKLDNKINAKLLEILKEFDENIHDCRWLRIDLKKKLIKFDTLNK